MNNNHIFVILVLLILNSCTSLNSVDNLKKKVLMETKKSDEIEIFDFLIDFENKNGFYIFRNKSGGKTVRYKFNEVGIPYRIIFKHNNEVFIFSINDPKRNKEYIKKNIKLFNKLFNGKWKEFEIELVKGYTLIGSGRTF